MTRQESMKDGNHREYYSQFVTEGTKQTVLQVIGLNKILKSKDRHLNDIPLNLWDNCAGFVHSKGCGGITQVSLVSASLDTKMREQGDYPTLAGLVCICKEAAKQIQEENKV